MISNIKAAQLLGWTSIAVGVTELVATQWLEDEMGVDNHKGLIRAYGVRELAAGVAILREPGINTRLAGALWARVAGDAIDIATLCAAATTTRKRSGLLTIAAIVLAVTGLDILVASLIQHDLVRDRSISESARARVTPTQALPAAVVEPTNESSQIPVSIGNA